MNSKERVLATLQGKPSDRCAISPILSLYGARLTDCPLAEYYTNSTAYARGQSAVLETFQPDILFGPFALPLEGEAFGSQVKFFRNQAPNLATPAIDSVDKMSQMAVPDLNSHPTLLYFREAIRIMAAEHGHQIPIVAIALDPVGLPAMIMGLEGWLQTLLFDKDGTKRMLGITIPHFIQWVNSLLADGAAFIAIPTAFLNPFIVTRQIATEVAIPALKEAFSQVNGSLFVHSAGAPLAAFIDLFADLPKVVGFILNERDSFAEARNKVGPEFTLIGNIEGPYIYKQKSEEIRAECRKILHDRRNDARFILGSSCADIAIDTPPENIHAFRQAAQEFAEGTEV
jgi:uroporphyrinogen decarboxylase